MTFLVRSTKTTQFSYCDLSLPQPASPSIHTAMCYFLLYHLSASNILCLSLVFHFIICSTRWTEISVCLLICSSFRDRVRHTVGKQKISVECCTELFCMDGSETYPKPPSHRTRHDPDPIPRMAKPRSKNWFAEGSQNLQEPSTASRLSGTHVCRSWPPRMAQERRS